MNDSVLKRYIGHKADDFTDAGNVSDIDAPDDFGAFGYLRGIRDRAIMLELRKKDGSILAKGYGWLESAEFDPSEGITLSFSGQKIRIKGRNLNAEARPLVRLFDGITRHKVPWIQESDHRASMTAADGDTVIDVIEC